MPAQKLIDSIIDFSTHTVAVENSSISSERMRSGIPCQTQTWNHYQDPSGQFFSGIWASSAGAFEVSYTEEELCVLLEGRVRLTDSGGQTCEFGPGGTFVIPAGFKGVWENLEPVKKIYAIWQDPNVTK